MGHEIKTFYDDRTSTLTYVVYDPDTRDAVVIDPVLDYDPKASKTWTESVDAVLEFLDDQQLDLRYVLETHAHADHLSGSQTIKEHYPDATLAIGEHITDVQAMFKDIFDLPEDFPTDGRQFDELYSEGDTIEAGSLTFDVIETPGHTPACVTYKIDDAIFTGDALSTTNSTSCPTTRRSTSATTTSPADAMSPGVPRSGNTNAKTSN